MLIEFKIQLDGNGGANVVPAQANPNPGSPPQKVLQAAFPNNPAAAPPPPANPAANAQEGGDQPTDGTGTGPPSSSGSGMVFVIGPIVVCGSGSGHSAGAFSRPGGDQPTDSTATGKPPEAQAAASNDKAAAPQAPDNAAKRRKVVYPVEGEGG
jgi:hypothetical protein